MERHTGSVALQNVEHYLWLWYGRCARYLGLPVIAGDVEAVLQAQQQRGQSSCCVQVLEKGPARALCRLKAPFLPAYTEDWQQTLLPNPYNILERVCRV
eukprot:1138300-Pelagomonas_calceolata.AAC.11